MSELWAIISAVPMLFNLGILAMGLAVGYILLTGRRKARKRQEDEVSKYGRELTKKERKELTTLQGFRMNGEHKKRA